MVSGYCFTNWPENHLFNQDQMLFVLQDVILSKHSSSFGYTWGQFMWHKYTCCVCGCLGKEDIIHSSSFFGYLFVQITSTNLKVLVSSFLLSFRRRFSCHCLNPALVCIFFTDTVSSVWEALSVHTVQFNILRYCNFSLHHAGSFQLHLIPPILVQKNLWFIKILWLGKIWVGKKAINDLSSLWNCKKPLSKVLKLH